MYEEKNNKQKSISNIPAKQKPVKENSTEHRTAPPLIKKERYTKGNNKKN